MSFPFGSSPRLISVQRYFCSSVIAELKPGLSEASGIKSRRPFLLETRFRGFPEGSGTAPPTLSEKQMHFVQTV